MQENDTMSLFIEITTIVVPVFLVIGILFPGAPTAIAACIMAQQMQGDEELSSTIIIRSTLFSIITYFIAFLVLRTCG